MTGLQAPARSLVALRAESCDSILRSFCCRRLHSQGWEVAWW